MFRRALVGLGLVAKLAGCGGSEALEPRMTGPDDFLYCAEKVRDELREELASDRKNYVGTYCELFTLDFMDRAEACLDEFGPYLHSCRAIDVATGKLSDYQQQVDTCVANVHVGGNEFYGLAAECTAYCVEEEKCEELSSSQSALWNRQR